MKLFPETVYPARNGTDVSCEAWLDIFARALHRTQELVERAQSPGYGPWEVFADMMHFNPVEKIPSGYYVPRYRAPHSMQSRATALKDSVGFDMQSNYRQMVKGPLMYTRLSDVLGLGEARRPGAANRMELDLLECIDYYGRARGYEHCAPQFFDMMERDQKRFQTARLNIMRRERNQRLVEYFKGEREFDTVYEPMPKSHSYPEPIHTPMGVAA